MDIQKKSTQVSVDNPDALVDNDFSYPSKWMKYQLHLTICCYYD